MNSTPHGRSHGVGRRALLLALAAALPVAFVVAAALGDTEPTESTSGVVPSASPDALPTREATSRPPALAQRDVGWVTGRIVDEAGSPVAGALVNVLDPGEVPEHAIRADESDRRANSDAQGRFRVRQSAKGYLVQVCQPHPERSWSCQETVLGVDYLISFRGPDGTTDSWLTQTRLFDASRADRRVGTIQVGEPAEVRGRIVGASYGPVQLMRLNDSVAFNMRTDAQGNYAFRGLVPGRYYIRAGGEGHLTWSSDPMMVTPASDAIVNTVLDRGATIAGTVVSANEPVAGVELVLTDGEGEPRAATTTDARGQFQVSGFEAGTYRVSLPDGISEYVGLERGVAVEEGATVHATLAVTRGARLDARVVDRSGRPIADVTDELRDAQGVPVRTRTAINGRVRYVGLRPGDYTIVVAGPGGYATRAVSVTTPATNAGTLRATRPLITLSGRSAAKAVVEATTGDLCPPDEEPRYGAWHQIVQADSAGRFTLTGLVPGSYMLGADGWPHGQAPSCRSDVEITSDSTIDVPLPVGGTVVGRLVRENGQPVITTLSYELRYAPGESTNPTGEHPARARTRLATGEFRIAGAPAGSPTGILASEAGDEINDLRFQVIFPFQDGAPYWLEVEPAEVQVSPGTTLELGDITVTLHGDQ